MEIKVEDESKKSQQQPLLRHDNGTSGLSDDRSSPITDKEGEAVQTFVQIAISNTFKSTAHLANLLPTGTVLAFQLLAPLTTNAGVCDSASRDMTAGLVVLLAVSCFILSFTDSFRDSSGRVRYGLATFHGMWVIDGTLPGLSTEEAAQYRIRFIDWVHGLMSVVVFAGVTMFDQNVVGVAVGEVATAAVGVAIVAAVGGMEALGEVGVVATVAVVVDTMATVLEEATVGAPTVAVVSVKLALVVVVTVWVAVASAAAVTVALVMVGMAAMEALVTVVTVASGVEVATMVEIMGAAMPEVREEIMVRAAMVEAGTKAAVAATLAMVAVASSELEVATESFPFFHRLHALHARRGAIFKFSYLFLF